MKHRKKVKNHTQISYSNKGRLIQSIGKYAINNNGNGNKITVILGPPEPFNEYTFSIDSSSYYVDPLDTAYTYYYHSYSLTNNSQKPIYFTVSLPFGYYRDCIAVSDNFVKCGHWEQSDWIPVGSYSRIIIYQRWASHINASTKVCAGLAKATTEVVPINVFSLSEKNPDDLRLIAYNHYYAEGKKCTEYGLYSEAIGFFDQAIKRYQNDATYYIARGIAKKNNQNTAGGIDDLEKALKIDSSKFSATDFFELGDSYFEKAWSYFADRTPSIKELSHNYFVKAQHFINKSILLKKLDTVNLAMAYSLRGTTKWAIFYQNKTIPNDLYTGVINDVNTAIALAPNQALYFYYRALINYSFKNQQLAETDIKKAVSMNPDNEQYATLKRTIFNKL